MIPIKEFLLNNLTINGIVIESSREDATPFTNLQELLTCFYFDYWFNGKGSKCKDYRELADNIVTDYGKLIEDTMNKVDGATWYKYKAILLNPKEQVPGESDKDWKSRSKSHIKSVGKWDAWIASFYYQCKSMEKYASSSKFPVRGMTFVQHNTQVGVCNGRILNGFNIVERVEAGRQLYGVKTKDDYQKADIYAVSNDKQISATPLEDPALEMKYWIDGAETDELGVRFLGISLKALGGVLNSVHIEKASGDEVDEYTVDDITVDFRPFDGVTFMNSGVSRPDGSNSPAFSGGLVTSSLQFHLNWVNKHVDQSYQFNVRSNSLSVEHAFNLKRNTSKSDPSKVLGYSKHPVDCFKPACAVELVPVGSKAQGGKVTNVINDLDKIHDFFDRSGAGREWINYSSSDLKKKLDNVKSTFKTCKIPFDATIPSAGATLIDYLHDNDNDFHDLLVKYDTDRETEMKDKEFVSQLFLAIKWRAVVWKQLEYLEWMANVASYAIKNKFVANPEDGMKYVLFNLTKGSKGSASFTEIRGGNAKPEVRLPDITLGL